MCGWLNKVGFFLNVGEVSRSDTICIAIHTACTVSVRQLGSYGQDQFLRVEQLFKTLVL